MTEPDADVATVLEALSIPIYGQSEADWKNRGIQAKGKPALDRLAARLQEAERERDKWYTERESILAESIKREKVYRAREAALREALEVYAADSHRGRLARSALGLASGESGEA